MEVEISSKVWQVTLSDEEIYSQQPRLRQKLTGLCLHGKKQYLLQHITHEAMLGHWNESRKEHRGFQHTHTSSYDSWGMEKEPPPSLCKVKSSCWNRVTPSLLCGAGADIWLAFSVSEAFTTGDRWFQKSQDPIHTTNPASRFPKPELLTLRVSVLEKLDL